MSQFVVMAAYTIQLALDTTRSIMVVDDSPATSRVRHVCSSCGPLRMHAQTIDTHNGTSDHRMGSNNPPVRVI